MAASRKLQGEIDRCLKKVAEGVEQFEDIWQKVHNATNTNQKEKYEADLKKEIKKLQRLRDQIKSWLASGEIKDKAQLLDNRKLIETQMERFKVVERETKTKAYSKEGLGAAQNKDPAQIEREELNYWLCSTIESLNIQIDQFESEIESLLATGKKKKMEKDKADRLDDLKEYMERHRFHIKKLEILMRMLDNQSVDIDQIKNIKDDIEYYVESCQDPDFRENTNIYDDIDMEDLEYQAAEAALILGQESTDESTPSSVCGSSPVPSPATNHVNENDLTIVSDKKRNSKSEEPRMILQPVVKPQVMRPSGNSSSSVSNCSSSSSSSSSSSAPSMPPSGAKATPPPPSTPTKVMPGFTSQMTPNNSSSSSTSNHQVSSQMNNNTGRLSPEAFNDLPMISAIIHNENTSNGMASFGTSSTIGVTSTNTFPTGAVNGVIGSGIKTIGSGRMPVPPESPLASPHGTATGMGLGGSTNAVSTSLSTMLPLSLASSFVGHSQVLKLPEDNAPTLKAMAQKSLNEGTSSPTPPALEGNLNVMASVNSSHPMGGMSQLSPGGGLTTHKVPSAPTCEAHIPPLLGVAPLGPLQLTVEHERQFKMLQAAFFHMPHPSDSERLRVHLPRQPCQTPAYYPQVSPPLADTVDFFQRLSTETLFFVFYYMEGTKAQYLAAKALKKQSWRFHIKHMMWFQRHEEPKAITDEYEQGTYIYFDFENWGQRKKENFTFEYRYLEDRDLN